jgi:hypothetical protein
MFAPAPPASGPVRAGRLPADDVRASDAERERVVGDLRAHAADGRLSVEELDERLERAYAARTRAELAALLTDLPRVSRAPEYARLGFDAHVASYVAGMVLMVAIWALTGMGYFWPIWPALGWGLGVLSHGGALRVFMPFCGPRYRRARRPADA